MSRLPLAMVLIKANVWYENVVKPLRRLTSATSNALSVGQRQTTLAASPCKSRQGDGLNAERSPVQKFKFGDHFRQRSNRQKQQQQQAWRVLLQNPLDVILRDSRAPGHPINIFSQSINKPFSTSTVDQARGQQPEKEPSRLFIGRSNSRQHRVTNRKTHAPRAASARQTEVGSKKYRKHFREKILRKGPHFNLRRQNRLCMQGCFTGSNDTSSLSILKRFRILADGSAINGASKKSVNLEGNITDLPGSTNLDSEVVARETISYSTKCHKNPREEEETLRSIILSPMNKLSIEAIKVVSGNSSNVLEKDAANTSTGKFSQTNDDTVMQPSANSGTLYSYELKASEEATYYRPACGAKPEDTANGRSMKAIVSEMHENMQEAMQVFKSNLWKRAVTGDTSFRGWQRCLVPAK